MNNAPVIKDIEASSEFVFSNSVVEFICRAEDDENDALSYHWSVEAGRLESKSDSFSVFWKSPGEIGKYDITVMVSDGNSQVSETLQVEVLETASVSGYIYFEGTKIPIGEATIKTEMAEAISDESGFFTFKIQPGNYNLQVFKEGFEVYEKHLTIKAGENSLVSTLISSKYTSVFSGKVTNAYDSDVVSGAHVIVLNPDASASQLVAETNEEGYYEIIGVPFGQRNIQVQHHNYEPFTGLYSFASSKKEITFMVDCIQPRLKVFSKNCIGLDSVELIANVESFCDQKKITGFCYSENSNPTVNDHILYGTEDSGIFKTSITEDTVDRLKSYYYRAFIETEKQIIYSNEYSFSIGILSDSRDNPARNYITVKIGDQTWMAENMAYLPEVYKSGQISANEARYYVFDYQGTNIFGAKDTENYYTYGVLYNWIAARDICPAGWHLPSKNDWEELARFVSNKNGGYQDAGSYWLQVGNHLKAATRWNFNGEGTDDFGFSGIPGGFLSFNTIFYNIGKDGYWWTGTESGKYAEYRNLNYSTSAFYKGNSLKSFGFSVRCIKTK